MTHLRSSYDQTPTGCDSFILITMVIGIGLSVHQGLYPFYFVMSVRKSGLVHTFESEILTWPYFNVSLPKNLTMGAKCSPSKSPGGAVRLTENRLSHGTPGKVKFLTKFRIVPKIFKKQRFYEKNGWERCYKSNSSQSEK